MKNLKIFTFGFLLIGLYLTSCKKDVDKQLQQSTPAENKENLFEKSLTVYSADKTSSTTLRFRAASKELLDKMSLENIEFTLDKAPELTPDASDLAAPATTEDAGFSNYSKGGALLPQSLTERMQIPTDAIQVELPSLPKIAAYSLNVKSKDEAVASPDLAVRFWYGYGYHKIKVINKYVKPIYTYFTYYAGGVWHYSGYNFKLFYNQYATYYNCSSSVGAEVDYPAAHNYKVTFYPSCL